MSSNPGSDLKKAGSINLKILDGFRGMAALYVMIGHARWLLWEGFSEGYVNHPDTYSSFEKMFVYFFSLFRYGHQAVLFFFVLSGFVIHLRYSKLLMSGNYKSFDVRDYFKRRIRRIYPPFLFILGFTLILDGLGHYLGFSIYYHTTPNRLINSTIPFDHSFVNFVGNLIFLQNERITVWGSDTPLWSLKYEWWFYVIYPLMLLVNKRNILTSLIFVFLLFFLTLFIHVSSGSFFINVLQYFLSWWMGVVLADMYTRRVKANFSWFAPLVLMIPVLIRYELRLPAFVPADTLWATGFFGLISLVFYLQQKGMGFKIITKLKWLGDCSYTLYIVHFPILVLFNGLLLHFNHNSFPKSQLYIGLAIIFIVTFSFYLHKLIERPFLRRSEKIPAYNA